MAIQKDYYVLRYDVTKQNAYWKVAVVDGIQGGKEKINVRMLCYKDKGIADTNTDEYGGFSFEFIPDLNSEDNFIKQAYLFAKTLPFFSGAVDA